MTSKTSSCLLLTLVIALSGFPLMANELAGDSSKLQVRGWNILSIDVANGESALDSSAAYHINHLQLSHQLIMDLKDVKNPKKLAATQKLIEKAKRSGIENILVWDHALYQLDY
jgi:hypothetical protein